MKRRENKIEEREKEKRTMPLLTSEKPIVIAKYFKCKMCRITAFEIIILHPFTQELATCSLFLFQERSC